MKADKWGTLAEQKRFEANWTPAKQRTDRGCLRSRKCLNCHHSEINTESRSGTIRCTELDVATRDSAICDRYRPGN
jgi:hypothetical protein